MTRVHLCTLTLTTTSHIRVYYAGHNVSYAHTSNYIHTHTQTHTALSDRGPRAYVTRPKSRQSGHLKNGLFEIASRSPPYQSVLQMPGGKGGNAEGEMDKC